MDFEIVSFGIIKDGKNIKAINYIILMIKYYIFQMKIRKTIPNFEKFKHFLHLRIIEKKK